MTLLGVALTPAVLVAAALVAALDAYVLLGGADFGGGVWDLLASGPRRDRQRALVADAIGPIWEANHVWLILVVVLLFTGFPPAFARLTTVLHVPLSLMLVGIVLRGSAFTFRSYDSRADRVQRRWGRIFAIASVITPVLLGTIVGTIAEGRAVDPAGRTFAEAFVRPWLAPFPLAVGGLTLAAFAHLAAVYLTVAAPDEGLADDFRRRALWSAGAAAALAALALVLAPRDEWGVGAALTRGPLALPVVGSAIVAAIATVAALLGRRYRAARVAAAAELSLVLWGWALAQLPWIVPPDLTITNAAAPARTLELLLIALGAGLVLLVPSLVYLYRLFGRPVAHE